MSNATPNTLTDQNPTHCDKNGRGCWVLEMRPSMSIIVYMGTTERIEYPTLLLWELEY